MLNPEKLNKLPVFIKNYIQELKENNKRLEENISILQNELNKAHGNIDLQNMKIAYRNARLCPTSIGLSQDSIVSFKLDPDCKYHLCGVEISYDRYDKEFRTLEIYGGRQLVIFPESVNKVKIQLAKK